MKHFATPNLIASIILATQTLSGAAWAEAPAAKPIPKSEVKHCIDLGWLDQSEVIDDQTILFHMKGGKIYENKLPYRCSGLKFEGGFSFATSLHQLCNTDIIRVLHQGTACGLGDFVPYEKPKKDKEPPKPAEENSTKK